MSGQPQAGWAWASRPDRPLAAPTRLSHGLGSHPGRCTSRLRVSRTKEFSQREAMLPRAALGDSGLPPSTPACVLRKEGPGLTASEPGAVSDNTTSRRLVAAEGSRSSADLRQMLLAKKQRTQDLPSGGLSENIPERSPDTPYSVCKSIEAVTTIEKPTTVTPCKGVPLARGAVPEDTSQSMLRLNKEPQSRWP